ncbi:3-ketodihydrosphingosine tsc10 [Cyphellophora attinorum]|uniref:3-ketodihydrosphingosine tsc10 n=1 Tax=Cyphellophora attinorum TaxID=1664694 RepID=A0A0N1HIM3_9EURO|nr:3-ketodihydrosphingosine tsc10 [Phialophora attinorum]KPI35972.1 3-ketodihydrosphingosine tsc10 [Phialophora attinorum]
MTVIESPFRNNYLLTSAAILVPLLLVAVMSLFRRKSAFNVSGRTVLITGGSQGMGLSVAQKLSARGANIVIVARDTAKLDSAISTIQSAASSPTSQRFLSLSYDLTDPKSAPEILARVTEWNNHTPPDVVWCCAGFCIPSFFADADIKTLRDQMDTLYWSCAYMAHATLNLWKRPTASTTTDSEANSLKSSGTQRSAKDALPRHLIFTCSCLAFFPTAGYAPYSPAKAAMRALADTLQPEIAVWNGARLSANPSISSAAPSHEIRLSTSPDEVAAAALRGLDAGEIAVTTNFVGNLMRGCGMGGTLRMGVMDVFWNFLGSIVILFFNWDFVKQSQRWGREKGVRVAELPANEA